MNPYLIVIIGYSLLLICLGLSLSRKVRTASSFFVADRALGPGLLFTTMLAANIGAGSTVGSAGLGYQLGLSGWWWVGSAGIGSLFAAFTIAPRLWRLARRHGFLTVGDFLEYRYDRRVRGLAASLLWVGTLAILAGQLIAVAWILQVTAGLSKPAGCLLGAVIVVGYFSAGGLHGSSRVNLLQLVIKAAGFAAAVPLALQASGGWETMHTALASGTADNGAFWNPVGIGTAGILGYLVPLAPAFMISPGLLQKVYGARDVQAVKKGAALQGLVLLGFAFFPVLLGMAAAAFSPGLQNPELALPVVMTRMLPFWLGALLLAAVLSAELSSADAILFMLTTSLSRDLYQGHIRPQASPDQLLKTTRWVAVAAGLLGAGMAILLPSVITALKIFYSLMTVSLFVPLAAGLYTRRADANTMLAAIVSAVPTAAAIHLASGGSGFGLLSPTAAGLIVSAGVMAVGLWRGR